MKVPFCLEHMAPRTECCARPDGPDAPHERGGPLPTLPPGYHPDLARIIQRARGMIHDGDEPMDVGAYVSRRAHELSLSQDDLRCVFGYLLKAADSKGRMDLMRDQRAAREMAKAHAKGVNS